MSLPKEYGEGLPTGSKPKIRVTTYGHVHGKYNLQAIPDISNALNEHLSDSSGYRIVFLENAGRSQSKSKSIEEEVNKIGRAPYLASIILRRKLNRSPSTKEVNGYIDLIASKELSDVIQEKLIPEQQIQSFFLYQALDSLRRDFSFRYEYEFHPADLNKEVGRLEENSNLLIDRAVDAWSEGNFQRAVDDYQAGYQIKNWSARLRDQGNVNLLKRRVNWLYQNTEGGSIFSLFGTQHYRQAIDLQKKIDKRISISIESNHEALLNSPAEQLSNKLGTPEAKDIDCARSLLVNLVAPIMVNTFKKIGKMAWFMQHYGSLREICLEAVSEFSLNELRGLCEKRTGGIVEVTNRIFSLGPQRLPMP